MNAPAELSVLLDRVAVGRLERLPGGYQYRFRYTDEWLRNRRAYPVSFALPLAGREHEGLSVRHWLRGLLPDNEARLLEIEAEFGVSRDDPYAVLAHVGEDCVGAVQFATPERAAEIASGVASEGVEWLDDSSLEILLREIAARSSPDRRVVRTGQFSLPGALGKVALLWDPAKKRWGRPSGQLPSTHILKPPIPGLRNHNENEHFCLELARAAGLEAAESRLVRFGEQGAIAVTRYDRAAEAGGGVRRLHQEDMAQALGLDPALKYAAEGGAGIPEVVRLLRDYAAAGDVDRFIHGVGFAWITAGTDAHLRNFSLLIGAGGGGRLAPLYDLATALGLGTRKGGTRGLRMAMAIGGHTALDEISRDAWLQETARSRLPKRLVDDVAALAERVAEAAPWVAERLIGKEGLDTRYLNRLARDVASRARGCAAELSRVPR
ncbi:MAG TPA: HipA domain-containing protein [Longimicrobium sp.]|nr:HipA domain-containing protein [Longimicrobium sp.]